MGEEVKAILQLDPSNGGPELEAILLSHRRSELAPYKCPRSIDLVDELLRNDDGKLYELLLPERYWTGRDSLIS